MTIEEYYALLEKHDWYYEMSDDHRVWKAGVAARDNLVAIAAEHGGQYQTLLDGFRAHYFSGDPWGTEKQPKPTL